MKISIITIFIITINFSFLYSQESDSLLSFYPLNLGNYWEFRIDPSDWYKKYVRSEQFSIEVIGDSILPNGKKYSVLEMKYDGSSSEPEIYFDRIDSSSYNIYRYNLYYSYPNIDEFLIDSLRANVGDNLERNYLCRITNTDVWCTYYEFSQDSILGYWTEIKKCLSGGWLEIDNYYWLANGIGLAHITAVDLNHIDTLYTWHLTYAKIGTKEYGLRTDIKDNKQIMLNSYKLYQNYPNPFNLNTEIKYEIYKTTEVELNIYNELGQRVKSEFLGIQKAGSHTEVLNFENMSSGLYFIELKTTSNLQRIKCLFVK